MAKQTDDPSANKVERLARATLALLKVVRRACHETDVACADLRAVKAELTELAGEVPERADDESSDD